MKGAGYKKTETPLNFLVETGSIKGKSIKLKVLTDIQQTTCLNLRKMGLVSQSDRRDILLIWDFVQKLDKIEGWNYTGIGCFLLRSPVALPALMVVNLHWCRLTTEEFESHTLTLWSSARTDQRMGSGQGGRIGTSLGLDQSLYKHC